MTEGRQLPAKILAERRSIGYVVLTFEFHKEGHLWVGRCVELGTATDGRSLDKVEDELAELVSLHLDALEDVGERERFFEEHSIKLYTPDPPKEIERRVPVSDERRLRDFRTVRVTLSYGSRDTALVGA